jgi:undecaprenyl-diphosphatase
MTLIHTINTFDTNLFLALNGLHNSFFDGFMSAFSARPTWIPLYVTVLYVVVKGWKKEAIWIALSFIACILIADHVSSSLIKEIVQRPRPSHATELQGVVHLVNHYRSGQFGFVSSHAANAVGFALISSLLFKRRFYTISIFAWAIVTAYSRIYLGVHYPLDILGGAVVGTFAALLCFWMLQKFRPLTRQNSAELPASIPVLALAISVVGLACYSIILSL